MIAFVPSAVGAPTGTASRVNAVILTVANYGRRLPEAAQVSYVEHAAVDIERADLAPAGWVRRGLRVTMTDSGGGPAVALVVAVEADPGVVAAVS